MISLTNNGHFVLIDTETGTLIDAATVKAVFWGALNAELLDAMNEGSDSERISIAEDFGKELFVI